MTRLLFVFGTRPEAIKMAPIILEATKQTHIFTTQVCVTGQHRGMLDQVLTFFKVKPDYDLSVMTETQSLTDLTTRILSGLPTVIQNAKPDIILVQGDTTTTFATALSAFYHHIPIAHIEAGLRSFDPTSPFPEELNRVLTSRLAKWHFTPTEQGAQNLQKEGISQHIHTVGNSVIDALLIGIKTIKENPSTSTLKKFKGLDPNKKTLLVTCHRRENWGDPLIQICEAIKESLSLFPDIQVLWPVHLNPAVSTIIHSYFDHHPQVILTPPLNYAELIEVMNHSTCILTDSGGIQEEAPSLGKPVLVLRKETERQEGIDSGTALLVGTDKKKIMASLKKLLTDSEFYTQMAEAQNPYGDGNTSQLILKILKSETQSCQKKS